MKIHLLVRCTVDDANVEEAAKEIVTPDFPLANCFFLFPHFIVIITRHGASWMAWAGCDDIEYL